MQEMKQRLELDEFIRGFQNIDMSNPKPEVSVSYRVSIRSLRIDVEGTSETFTIKLIPRNTRLQYCVNQDGHFTIQNAPTVRMR